MIATVNNKINIISQHCHVKRIHILTIKLVNPFSPETLICPEIGVDAPATRFMTGITVVVSSVHIKFEGGREEPLRS